MFERNNVIIAKEKSKDFNAFIKQNAKNKEFWIENKRIASLPIDKEALEKAFK